VLIGNPSFRIGNSRFVPSETGNATPDSRTEAMAGVSATAYALKYPICVVVAISLPDGDHSSPVWS
jgi:hypothetical protein